MKTKLTIMLLLMSVWCSAANFTITGQANITMSGDHVVTLDGDANVTVKNGFKGTIQFNSSNNGRHKYIVMEDQVEAWLPVLNLNGKLHFTNYSAKVNGGNMDIQNGDNSFRTYKSMSLGVFQLTDNSTVCVYGCETVLTLTGNTTLDGQPGSVQLFGGGRIITGHLDVNAPNMFTGEGMITRTSGNTNHDLSLSSTVRYCGPLISKLGLATATCTNICPGLPVVVSFFEAKPTNEGILVIYRFSDLDKLRNLKVVTGLKGNEKIHRLIERKDLRVNVKDSVLIPNYEL